MRGERLQVITCGSFHSAAVTEDSRLYTWGHGGEGRLGHLDEASQVVS